MDLFGPTQYTSIGGNKYGFVIVDDYTDILGYSFQWTKVMCLQHSNHLSRAFTMSLKQPSRELEVTMVVSSRIQELMSYDDEFRIRHQFSAKYTPQSNGLIERKNRTLIDMTRSMLSEYNVSQSFWAEAINTACCCSNRLYCHPLKEKTPTL